MLKKHGKYFADWRDERGRRHRKSFATAHEAKKYQTKQQSTAAAKKAPASGPRGKSSKHSPKHSRATTTRPTSPKS
ncbi:MAG: hypothetical protein HY234_15650 [Acidobacteria bacterium]|nr:hypothetical protein [Acidobacteriota bacterium]MBI3664469.1 hypothetical protein [Acidobacteriota bacterium]